MATEYTVEVTGKQPTKLAFQVFARDRREALARACDLAHTRGLLPDAARILDRTDASEDGES